MVCPNCKEYFEQAYWQEGFIDNAWRRIMKCKNCGTKWFIKTDYTIDESGPYPVRYLRTLRVIVPE